MNINIKQYEKYLCNDEPIPYKNLFLYPVVVENYMDFHIIVNCLLLQKNNIPDPKVISMSYLDFIFWYANQSDENGVYLYLLCELLKMCLKLKDEDIKYKYNSNGKVVLILKDEEYDQTDFNNLKKIICEQQMIDLNEDENISPELKQALEEAQEFKNRANNRKKLCSFEDQLVCIMIALNTPDIDKIKRLTIRKFSKILERYDHKLHYEIYKQSEMSGMVEFKEDIDHWMSEISKKNKYKDVMVDYEEFQNKVNGNGNIAVSK